MRLASRSLLLALGLALGLPLSSCVSFQRWQKGQTQKLRQIELEDVAKSWCQTIRASQVIPVYPLTEDLMPGDVFLVQTTLEEQSEEYLKRGFLPLDYQLARIPPSGYVSFYSSSILPVASHPNPASYRIPGEWMRPAGTLPGPGQGWREAPRAAFPSYSFSVKAGGGFNLALPVSGVPVGMSLMAAQSASGTLSIQDARTIGVDLVSLERDLRAWGRRNRQVLAPYASRPQRPSYLRVVSRIYLIGAIDVSLNSSQSGGLGIDAGAPRPVALPEASETAEGQAAMTSTERYADNLTKLNESLGGAAAAAGGSLRITSATASTVTMHETFDPPLVLGYLGFDCEVLAGGELGPAVPTRVSLSDPSVARRLARGNRALAVEADAVNRETIALIRLAVLDPELPEELLRMGREVLEQCDALARFSIEDMPVYKRLLDGSVERKSFAQVRRPGDPGYRVFLHFKSNLRNSRVVLTKALADAPEERPEWGGADLTRIVELLEAAPWSQAEHRALVAGARWKQRFGTTIVE